jgi:hypothetical protein
MLVRVIISMKPGSFFIILVFSLLIRATAAADAPSDAKQFWPQWRGPLATGVAPNADPPLEWSETENVKWKVKIPGLGDSTPIVWGNRVYILSAVPTGKKAATKTPEAATPSGEKPLSGEGRPGREGGRGGFGSQTPTEAYQFVILCLDRNTGKILW